MFFNGPAFSLLFYHGKYLITEAGVGGGGRETLRLGKYGPSLNSL